MDEAHAGSKGHKKYVPWALTMQWWRSDNTEIRNPHLEEKPAKPPKQGTAGKKWTQKSGDYGGGLESKVYLLEEKVMELQQEVQMLSGTAKSLSKTVDTLQRANVEPLEYQVAAPSSPVDRYMLYVVSASCHYFAAALVFWYRNYGATLVALPVVLVPVTLWFQLAVSTAGVVSCMVCMGQIPELVRKSPAEAGRVGSCRAESSVDSLLGDRQEDRGLHERVHRWTEADTFTSKKPASGASRLPKGGILPHGLFEV